MSEATWVTAAEHGLQGCGVCTALSPREAKTCRVCESHLHAGWDHSLQATWAWLITGMILYIPANVLPIMYTTTLGRTTENTILGGVITLWEHGSYPVATIIFLASVFVPIAKFLVLGWLCVSVRRRGINGRLNKARMYRLTELIGRWSMVDVFVVAILVALIRLGNVMTVLPGSAAIAFAGMVATTMIAANVFDSRLIWQERTNGDPA